MANYRTRFTHPRWTGLSLFFALILQLQMPAAAQQAPPIAFLTAQTAIQNTVAGGYVAADFNGDGKTDLVAFNEDFTISLLLSNGDGTFRTGNTYAISDLASAGTVGDFNGDGKLDLVTANISNRIEIFFGNADGTLRSAGYANTGRAPSSVATADLNGDGKLDLVVTNSGSNTVSVFLGNGDGTFQPRTDYAAGYGPASCAIGDFNRDGKLDFAVATNSSDNTHNLIMVYLSNGDGTFQPGVAYPTGGTGYGARSVAVSDFNGDGNPDLVAVNNAHVGTVSVLLGNRDGTFQPPVEYSVGASPYRVVVGDYNHDGKPDLLVLNNDNGTVSVLLGVGDGTFQPRVDYIAGLYPYTMAVSDFTGDGRLSIVTADYLNGAANRHFLLGNGDGTFQAALSYPANSLTLAAGDFNGDGRPDLVVTDLTDSALSVLLGNGDDTFQPAKISSTADENIAMVTADFNGDGHLDLATCDYNNTVSIYLGNGDGTFQSRHILNGDFYRPESIAVGDLNGDGKPDLVVGNNGSGTVSVLLGNGDGTFQPPVNYTGGSTITSVGVGDFDGDGKLDIVAIDYNSFQGMVRLFKGNGDGSFQSPISFSAGNYATALAVGDLNKDGKLDLVVANTLYGSSNLTVFLGKGDLTFQPASSYATGSTTTSVVIADLNGDGIPDLAATNQDGGDISVLRGNGDGTFQPAVSFLAGFGTSQLAVSDFNGDGRPDIAVANPYSNTLAILTNVTASAPVSLQIHPKAVVGGHSSTGTVTLSFPAPTIGEDIDLYSGDTVIVTVPSHVHIAPNSLQGTFSIATSPVAASESVTITASLPGFGGGTQTAVLKVNLPTPASVTFSPDAVIGGRQHATGTITLNGRAAVNTHVTLTLISGSAAIATMPARITVRAGARSAPFYIRTNPVATTTTVQIQAAANGGKRTGTLIVYPPSPTSK